jgi:hypothetical protein
VVELFDELEQEVVREYRYEEMIEVEKVKSKYRE